MAKTKEQKKQDLDKLKEDLEKSKSVVFANYQGLGVNEVNELRATLFEVGAKMTIVKNSLLKLINKDINLKGQTAVIFSYESQVEPIKKIYEFIKKYNSPIIKLGILDGEIIEAERVEVISKLPSMDELRAKLVGSMQSPISGFTRVTSGVYTGFVRVLNEYKNNK